MDLKEKVKQDEFDMMWAFLQMGYQKSNIPMLVDFCEQLKTAMTQKTAGQSKYGNNKSVDWNDLNMIINGIVVETMALYLSGDLEKLNQKLISDGAEDGSN